MIDNGYTSAVERNDIDEGLRSYFVSVYNYMTGGLLLTALTAYIVANTSLLGMMFTANGLSGLGWLFLIAPLLVVFGFQWVLNRGTLAQVRGVFVLYSALIGVSLAPVAIAYTGASIARVFLITAGTFGAMSIYGYTTKRNLSAMGSFLIMGLWGIIIASIVNIFLKSSGLDFALSFLGVLLFTGLTAYDTQKIRAIYMSADSYDTQSRKVIVGALGLYLDFINMFLYLLRFFGDRRS